ncbi:unnamed protein product [Cochlearia groenlandica]
MADLKQSKTTTFPRLFTAFCSFKSFTENDAVASPTSILDTKPFSALKNPFGSDNPKTQEPETRVKIEPKRTGLAIVDSLIQEPEPGFSKPRSGTVLFGSNLRIQVSDPPRSSSDFGIKTKNKPVSRSDLGSDRIFTSEIELSEDYTCVTCHGPNPRTIHIFDDCVFESQHGVVFFRSSDPVNDSVYSRTGNFLSRCCNCKKNLGPSDDIFMYRGERAFCSSECRSLEMMSEENDI